MATGIIEFNNTVSSNLVGYANFKNGKKLNFHYPIPMFMLENFNVIVKT